MNKTEKNLPELKKPYMELIAPTRLCHIKTWFLFMQSRLAAALLLLLFSVQGKRVLGIVKYSLPFETPRRLDLNKRTVLSSFVLCWESFVWAKQG